MKILQQKRNALTIAVSFIAVGGLFLLNSLKVIHLAEIITHLWAMILVLAGVYILLYSLSDQSFLDKVKSKFAKKMTARYAIGGGEANILGDLEILLTDDTIQSGRYQTLMGNLVMNAGQLNDLEGPHYLDLAVLFGEIQVLLPQNLPVYIKTRNIGGTTKVFEQRKEGLHKLFTYKSESFSDQQPGLMIICNALVGNINIERI